MILNIYQTKTSFNMKWEIYDKKNTGFAIAESPFEKGQFQVFIQYNNGEQRLYYNPMDVTWGTKLADRMSFKLFEAGEKIGNIVGKTKKTGFLKAYAYYEFQYKDRLILGYEVGFGSKGLYLCIYENDKLVAIVDKKLRVINFKDSYTVYLEDEKYASIVIPFVLYYDSATYGDVMELAVASISEKRVNTLQKELIAKYDPEFIEKIIAMDEMGSN